MVYLTIRFIWYPQINSGNLIILHVKTKKKIKKNKKKKNKKIKEKKKEKYIKLKRAFIKQHKICIN